MIGRGVKGMNVVEGECGNDEIEVKQKVRGVTKE